ncbi:MAG: AMP-binding protein [Corynebacterium sp.]|uniref:(2,3-dihydroxybenzoyl)adenylate synthase n=1 Tax=Corynebacterium sp. TaxID=1720 RepID=UPI0026DBBD18|nr:AMP-binding protein [Corynebacterium sp.]MDO4761656.1 AMP-binding protein [Corynebacterium sp.]
MLYPDDVRADYLARGLWTTETFAEFFDVCSERYSTHTALVGHDLAGTPVRLSYTQLADAATTAAILLREKGVQQGDYVLVQLPNVVEFVVVIGALWKLGARPVFCLPAHRKAELSHFAQQSQARMLITCHTWAGCDHAELAAEIASQVEGVEVLVLESVGDLKPAETPTNTLSPAEVSAFDVAFLQVSGGTTGIPKLIPRSHADYLYSVRESAKICQLDTQTKFLVVLPVSHNFTMSSPGILGVFYAGGTVVLNADPSPSTSFELIASERITMAALVPPLVNAWLMVAKMRTPDLSSLRMLQVGGAKLTEQLARRVQPELGCRLQQVFGMAEGLVCYTRPEDSEELVVSTQGRPISADDEIRIVDDYDQPVPAGQRGHLLTRGPYTIRGYFAGVAPHSFTEDGFYRTGDIVRQLDSGHLIVEGRDKDQINRGGEKISAEEIEDHLIAHPDVFDAALVGVPDETLGEKCCAWIVVNNHDDTASAKELGHRLRQHLRARGVAEFKIPDFFQVVSAFPVTGVGKTSRKQLRALLKDHSST